MARIRIALISSFLLASLALVGCEDDPTDLDYLDDAGTEAASSGSPAPELDE